MRPTRCNPAQHYVTPVLVVAHDRAEYLRACLEAVFRTRGDGKGGKHPVFVSQDGTDAATADVARSFPIAALWHYDSGSATPEASVDGHVSPHIRPYYRISRHYGYALSRLFDDCREFARAIVLEEDMVVSPDFFSFMSAMAPILDEDPTVYAISSWNDNGLSDSAVRRKPRRAYRSDFFPGLGWMLRRALWRELTSKGWPEAYWDDW